MRRWSRQNVRPDNALEHGCAFVKETYLSSSIRRTRRDAFPGFMRRGRFDGCRVSDMTLARAGTAGARGTSEFARDVEVLYTLVYIARGRGNVVIDGREISLPQRHFVLRDATIMSIPLRRGFADARVLSRAFKRADGVTPREFRIGREQRIACTADADPVERAARDASLRRGPRASDAACRPGKHVLG